MKNTLINILYFIVIFAFTFLVAGVSLARKLSFDNLVNRQLILTVQKEKITLSNTAAGTVNEVLVRPGDRVKEGQVVVKLSDSLYKARLRTLENLGSDNLSAQTEAALLRLDSSSFNIVASKDGIVQEVNVSDGSYIQTSTSVMTIYTNENAVAFATVGSEQLSTIQKIQKVDGLNQRLGLSFTLNYKGVEKVQEQTNQGVLYKVLFNFENPTDAEAFLDNETVEVVSFKKEIAVKPAELFANVWNKITKTN